MAALLGNLRNTLVVSFVLALVMIFAFGSVAPGGFDRSWIIAVLRWTHVVFGILCSHRTKKDIFFLCQDRSCSKSLVRRLSLEALFFVPGAYHLDDVLDCWTMSVR